MAFRARKVFGSFEKRTPGKRTYDFEKPINFLCGCKRGSKRPLRVHRENGKVALQEHSS